MKITVTDVNIVSRRRGINFEEGRKQLWCKNKEKIQLCWLYGLLTCINLLLRIWLSYSKRDEFIRTVGLKANEDLKNLDKAAKSE